MIKEYLLQNWSLLLILSAFSIALHISVFLDRQTVKRMLVLITGVFLLSITLIRRSNKKMMEIVPILFMSIALVSQLVFPFVFGSDFSKVFCPTLGVALFIYYVFEILQQTKKDSLTGLLNRNAFETDIENNPDGVALLDAVGSVRLMM